MEEWEVINNLACIREDMKQSEDLSKETMIETINAAITGLEEVQQYRAIGKVEELIELKERDLSGLELAQIAVAVKMLKAYEAIGTIEECREAREKQQPKKAVKKSFIIPYRGINVCPNCKEPINQGQHHCYCGQAIDWR